MASSSASPSVLRDLCHALAGDFGATFTLVERGGQTEPSGKENGEATHPLSKTRQMAMPSTSSTSSSPAALDDLDAALDDGGGDRALTCRRHRRTRHRLRARMATENASSKSNASDSSLGEQLSAIASLGATVEFLEAAARVLTTTTAAIPAEACAFGWELSRLLEEYRECVLELEARVSEEEEEAAAAGDKARASSSSSSATSSSSSSLPLSLPLPVPRIRIHLGEWPVVLEEVAALAELALECMDGEEEEGEGDGEEEEKEGDRRKTKRREQLLPCAVPPAAALARAAAALSRCGAPRVEAAAARISAAIERAQLLALADWCCCCARGGQGAGGAGGFWVISRRRPETVGGEEEEEAEAEKSEVDFFSFELVPAALPPFLSAEAARDALFVGCAARAFSSRERRSTEEEGDGYDGGNGGGDDDDGENSDNAGEETRRALLSLLSSSSSSAAAAAPEQQDDNRELLSTTATLRPTAVASVLAGARERAERRLFRRCCFRPCPPLRGGDSSPSALDPLRAALESLRRVALLGDAALWGAALRSGHLRAALENIESGKGGDVSSALEAAADDSRGAATPAALDALFSSRGAAPLRLAVVLIPPEKEKPGTRSGRRVGKDGDREEALWSRLTVRRRGRAAWPLGLLPLFSSSSARGDETRSSSCSSSSSSDPWRTVEALFSALLALERASLALEEAYLSLRSSARGRRALVSASAGNGIGGSNCAAGTTEGEGALLSLWRAHGDAAFAVRGALSHLREDVLSPADRELDAALLRLRQGGGAGAGAGATAGVAERAVARPWTLAAAALARWRSRVASCSLLSLSLSAPASASSGNPVAEALAKLCRACHAIRSAVGLASLLEEGEEEQEEQRGGGGDARALAAASASALLAAAAGASEAARALAAAAAAAEAAAQESRNDVDDRGDDFAASHRAMLLGRVSFG